MTKEKLLEIIYQTLPDSDQITGWDFQAQDALIFSWKEHRLKVTLPETIAENCVVYELNKEKLNAEILTLLCEMLKRTIDKRKKICIPEVK